MFFIIQSILCGIVLQYFDSKKMIAQFHTEKVSA